MNLKLKQNHKAYLLIGYAFLLFIHFVIKDLIFPISIIYYCFPLPIIIGLGIILMSFYFRKKVYFFSLFILVGIITFHWLSNYYYVQFEKTPVSDTSKILFWNVAKKKQLPIDIIINETNLHKPNILAFVEAKNISEADINKLSEALPDYIFKDLYSQMLVGVKGQLNSEKKYVVEESHKISLINATINNEVIDFIISDVYAHPFINKKLPLKAILDIAESNNVSFLVGDFNTPYESVHFSSYFKNYTSFHSYSEGFTATWPLGIPLFEIDHIWINKKFVPISLEKKYFKVSDHALLIAEYE
nr:endonuclease/exonuclease/phosphatase family protein [uncultured Psychroserpens sp.]